MYIGFYESVCTKKNQLTFPSKLRELTGEKLFIAPWFEKSLIVLPLDLAERTLDKILQGGASLIPEVRDLETILYAEAQIVNLDVKNRFVLGKHLREYARLSEKTVFLGIKDRIELWDQEVYSSFGQIRKMQIKQTAINLYSQIVNTKKS